MSEALLSFSLLLNISKLGSHAVGSDTLAPIHGLRFISMLWIIMVHTCLLANEVSGRVNSSCCELEITLRPAMKLVNVSGNFVKRTFRCLIFLIDNKMFRTKAEEDFLYQTISNGTYAVDTFFFIRYSNKNQTNGPFSDGRLSVVYVWKHFH